MNRTKTDDISHALRMSLVFGVIIAVTTLNHVSLWACGSCTLPGSLRITHPESLNVAISIRREIDAGSLDESVSIPKQKTNCHFRDLQTGRILAERFGLREGFELLIIEDGSHYRIESAIFQRDRKRTALPTIRWVTGRIVLYSMLENKMDFETAVERGLIIVEKTEASNTSRK